MARLKECLPDAHGLAGFEQVLLQDGSSFALHPQLAEHFPADSISTARCGRVSYDHVLAGPVADIDEYHGGYRIRRKHLPAANSLNNKLLLADAGYISRGTLLM